MASVLQLYSGLGTITDATSTIHTFSDSTFSSFDEKKILNALYQGTADEIIFDQSVTKDDITEGIFNGVMVTSSLPESSTIMSLNFQNDTDVVSTNHSAELIYSNSTTSSLVKKNTMELGQNTAPLYVGHLKFEFTDGDSVYTSDNGHRIALDTTDTDYNYFKAANSVLSNLDSSAVNGIQGGFDNIFNRDYAFYTENIISRDSTSNQLVAGDSLGNAGISSSTDNKLTVSILEKSSDNVPLFGSLKMVQDTLEVSFTSVNNNNNTNGSSTMSVLASTAILTDVPIITSAPPQSMLETDFTALFTTDYLAKVGPGYTFDLVIGAEELGGYDINNDSNKVTIPTYSASNLLNTPTLDASVPMFELDDSDIHENLRYMREMSANSLFDDHAFNIRNGTLVKDSAQEYTNKNFGDFDVLDGAESLTVTTLASIADLTSPGIIEVINTNNTLNNDNARFQKNGTNANVNRLIVNYETGEADHLLDVGTLSQELQDNYFVKSKIDVLAKSTYTNDAQWDDAVRDVAMANDSALVFQSAPDSTLFSKSNILSYSALELNNIVGQNDFALIGITKHHDLSSSYNESPMVQTSAGNDALTVTSSIRLSNMNLNAMNINNSDIDDLRVTLTCKQKDDMPTMAALSNSPSSEWFTSSSETSVLTNSDVIDADANGNYLISQKGGKTLLGPDIYKMMNSTNPLSVKIELTTNEQPVENRDILEIKAFVTLVLPAVVPAAVASAAAAAFAATGFVTISNITPADASNAATRFTAAADAAAAAGFTAAAAAFTAAAAAFTAAANAFTADNSNIAIAKAAEAKTIYDTTVAVPIINKRVEVDEKDLVFQQIALDSTINRGIQNLSGLGLTGALLKYEVKQYVTTKEYNACIRVKIGAYKNLWSVTQVKEEITWYQLYDTNQDKILPDYYLSQITQGGVQAFKTTSKFINISAEVSTIGSTSEFRVADLMGFKVGAEYGASGSWTAFDLAPDLIYGNSADLMYDHATTVTLKNGTANFGTVTLSIDSPKLLALGLASHKGSANPMYMINLSIPKGKSAFDVVGYKYSIANDSQYFNKDKTWSPYAVGDALFLKDVDGINKGTAMGLTTIVELIEPTPGSDSVNNVNKVKVRIMSGETELASFISDKWILENFNIIMNRGPIVQHDYVVSRTDSSEFATEYLHAVHTLDDNFYAKMLYGADRNGVRVELLKTSVRGESSEFSLKGDRLYMSPLVSAVDNAYSGLYSDAQGTEILPSGSGYPLPTDSTIHRNICPKKFRGYKNGQAQIDVLRTVTHIKMVFGDKFQDDMNTHSISNIAGVWKNRGSNSVYPILQANDIRSVEDGGIQPANMGIVTNSAGPSIGSLGLKVVPKYSMFPTIIGSLYQIPITVTPANYTKVITNPLDQTINIDVTSDVFDVVLHHFEPFDIVATRIKVGAVEKFNFKYGVPDLQVYYSPQYVGDPRSINNDDWTYITSYSDAQIRSGQTVSYPNFGGVVEFKRVLTPVSSYIKYGILPRPTAFVEAYDITDLSAVTLPSNLSAVTRKRYYCDIDITTSGFGQDLAPASQQHKPFAKAPSASNNPVNAVAPGVGLNNLTLGFNVTKYLNLKYTDPVDFSFTLTSNRLKISNGVGLSDISGPLTEIFSGKISELTTPGKWVGELQGAINNEFTIFGKKWNVNTRQLHSAIANFVNFANAPATLSNKYLYINGITSFALGTYYLDLPLLDSVVASFYSYDRSYNTTGKTVDVKFAKYTTNGVINWATNDQFTKCENFRPLITKKETFTLPVQIVNQLTATRFNVEDLIKTKVSETMSSTTIGWTADPDYVQTYSPIRICPLSIPGSVLLHEIMQVNKEFPCRIVGFNRPSIVLIKSADGSTVTKITPDGILSSNKMITEILQLEPTNILPEGTQSYIGGEAFYGNINPTIGAVHIVT